jgi:hypothetical protein
MAEEEVDEHWLLAEGTVTMMSPPLLSFIIYSIELYASDPSS